MPPRKGSRGVRARFFFVAFISCVMMAVRCSGGGNLYVEERSLFREVSEVLDVNSTNLSDVHDAAHLCPWIFVAYSSGCGHCREAAPRIAEVAADSMRNYSDVLSQFTFAAMNCATKVKICRDLGVRYVPAYFLILPSFLPLGNILSTRLTLNQAGNHTIDPTAVAARTMTLVRMQELEYLHNRFATARKMLGNFSAPVWGAAERERCWRMRSELREQKKTALLRGDAGAGAAPTTTFLEDTRFHSVDVANAFFETLYREVALVGLETAAKRHALLQFLHAVHQRLPGLHAGTLLHSIATRLDRNAELRSPTEENFFSVTEWQEAVLAAGIPFSGTPSKLTWQTCRGSSWRYRGFPCGMWLLYHSLTANAPSRDGVADGGDGDVLLVIMDYASRFFSCEVCRQHFLQLQPDEKTGAVLQLWQFHNTVNRRLLNATKGVDPMVPKRIFPTPELCPICHRDTASPNAEDSFNFTEVEKYLRRRYRWNMGYERELTLPAEAADYTARGVTIDTETQGSQTFLDAGGLATILVVIAVALFGTIFVLRRSRRIEGKKRRRTTVVPIRMRL